MLDRLLKEIPRLTDAVARAEFDGHGSYEVTETGAADTMREVAARPSAPPAVERDKRSAQRAACCSNPNAPAVSTHGPSSSQTAGAAPSGRTPL